MTLAQTASQPNRLGMTAPILTVNALRKDFGATAAVRGIDFAINPGQTVALLGGNGAGKTTTLGMLLGILTPTSGQIQIFGHAFPKDRFAALARMNFSSPYVDLPQRLTVYENLRVYGRLLNVRGSKARIAELSDDLRIGDFLHKAYGKLSSGQKTRVAIAKALLNKPELLLLDEPTASLDPDTADWLRGYLETYQRQTGCSILLASHNMAEVERLCHQVLILKQGLIVDRGAPKDLIEKYGRQNMEQVFLDIARRAVDS
jgi:ABC-2 type transport system ATP-binding protein